MAQVSTDRVPLSKAPNPHRWNFFGSCLCMSLCVPAYMCVEHDQHQHRVQIAHFHLTGQCCLKSEGHILLRPTAWYHFQICNSWDEPSINAVILWWGDHFQFLYCPSENHYNIFYEKRKTNVYCYGWCLFLHDWISFQTLRICWLRDWLFTVELDDECHFLFSIKDFKQLVA